MTEAQQSYGKVDKFLHWWVVLNMGATMIFSRGMSELPMDERVLEYGDHGTSVTTLMAVMIFRLFWRLTHPIPGLPSTMKPWEVTLAHLMHRGLYVMIFVQMGIGILLASTTERDFVPSAYGFSWTAFDLVGDENYELLNLAHNTGYWILVGLVLLHIVAALKHHFVDKDIVLKRMLPFVKV